MMRARGALLRFAFATGLVAASGGRAHGATGDGLLGTYYPNATLTEPYASQRVDAQIGVPANLGKNAIWFEFLGWVVADTPVTVGEWSHLAVVYSDAADEIRFYLNGQPDGTATGVIVSPTSGGNLRIGTREDAGGSWFDGLMDDVRVYDRALSFNDTLDYNDCVDCGTDASLNTPSMTVAYRMNADLLQNSIPVDKLPLNTESGWTVKLRNTGAIWFRIGAEIGGADEILSAAGVYSVGMRMRVAATYDQPSGVMKLYVDGVEKGNTTSVRTLNAPTTPRHIAPDARPCSYGIALAAHDRPAASLPPLPGSIRVRVRQGCDVRKAGYKPAKIE